MSNFEFYTPTHVYFGRDTQRQVGDLVRAQGCKKVLVHFGGQSARRSGLLDQIEASLAAAGVAHVQLGGVVPNPHLSLVYQGIDLCKKEGVDFILAVGGGSVIDTAKAMCMLITNEGSVKEYLFGGSKTVENPSLPLIAVPTTAGSGSEVSAASVITDEENDIKLSVSHEYLMPKFAIIDPLQQIHMPAFITATTGMDALTHAIESYVSLNANPFSDAYGEMAIRLIGEIIRAAVHDPLNLEAREKMAVASTLAGTAFVNGGMGAVHGISQAM